MMMRVILVSLQLHATEEEEGEEMLQQSMIFLQARNQAVKTMILKMMVEERSNREDFQQGGPETIIQMQKIKQDQEEAVDNVNQKKMKTCQMMTKLQEIGDQQGEQLYRLIIDFTKSKRQVKCHYLLQTKEIVEITDKVIVKEDLCVLIEIKKRILEVVEV